ncbi:MAG: glucose-1-phosphate adenylyltransferase [Gammaproteobacteria bacterium]|nr:glucose-1-phosphate adenylyltransferase [Gammaproteobacteria bacterium]
MDNNVVASVELPRRTVAIVLAGGRGSRLLDLTTRHSKPAVFFGGKFRIVDFALSNAVNSGVRRIAVLTQYTSHSLIRHIQMAWGFLRSELNEFVQVLPANQRAGSDVWYQGTADAVFQNREVIRSFGSSYTLILAGDHVYKMDYAIALADHVHHGRGCSIACIEVPKEKAKDFGVLEIGQSNRVTRFVEKPEHPHSPDHVLGKCLVSMGIYIFDTAFLLSELERDAADPNSTHDFGRDVIPRLVREGHVTAHRFESSAVNRADGAEPYWRDVGTLDSYWDANIDLTTTLPLLNLYDERWPIWTYQAQLPPAKFVHNSEDRRGIAFESLVASGCIVSGTVDRSVLFSGVRVHSRARLELCVVLPGVTVGHGARVARAVIDRDCRIPPELIVGEDPELDDQRFVRSPNGVTLITQEMLDRLANNT